MTELETDRLLLRQWRDDDLVQFAAATNLPSQRVMQGLDMRRDPAEDFDHPALPEGPRLRRHVLYRIMAADASTCADLSSLRDRDA